MGKRIVFATGNPNKVREVKEMLLPLGFDVVSLKELGLKVEAEEVATTFEGNARIKALDIVGKVKDPVLADDSGLCIHALGDFPGVHSSRFMEGHSYQEKCEELIRRLDGKEDRSATFFCCLVYIDKRLGIDKAFLGRTEGSFTRVWDGEAPDQFGYDPCFYSDDLKKTFGRASAEEKNAISHRGRAMKMFFDYLSKNL